MSNVYGYVRVSTREQNEDRQLIALTEAGVNSAFIHTDKQSGKDFLRPEYMALVEKLRPGDLIVIKSIDRLGRNYEEIQAQWRFLVKEKQADIRVLDMPLLDTRTAKDLMGTFIADLTLQILSFVAESERNNIKERQREGIEAAKFRGVRFGRPARAPTTYQSAIVTLWRAKAISTNEAMKRLKFSRSSLYRYAKHISPEQARAQINDNNINYTAE